MQILSGTKIKTTEHTDPPRASNKFTDFEYSLDTSRLSTNVIGGRPSFLTRKYSPPEVLDYEERDSRFDVWALGCVFIEILSVLVPGLAIKAITCFSEAIEGLHASILGMQCAQKYRFLTMIATDMTAERINSSNITRDCRTAGYISGV